MEQIDRLVKTLSAFSAITVSLTAILTFLALIFKPVRRAIVWCYKKIVGAKSRDEAVLKRIGEVENTLSTKIDDIKTDLDTKIQIVSKSNDKNELKRCRWEILDFSNSCKNGRKHTYDEFRHIMEIHDDYEKLLEATGNKNGFLDAEFDYIKDVFSDCQKKNNFL